MFLGYSKNQKFLDLFTSSLFFVYCSDLLGGGEGVETNQAHHLRLNQLFTCLFIASKLFFEIYSCFLNVKLEVFEVVKVFKVRDQIVFLNYNA